MSKTPKITRFITHVRKVENEGRSDGTSIIILGGGIGYRMKSYGPKSLIDIGGETILDSIVENINLNFDKNKEIILTIGFEADKVIKKMGNKVRLVENQLFETKNQLEEVRLALNNCVYNKVLILTCDLIFNRHTLDNIKKHGSTILVDSRNQMNEDEIGVTVLKDKASIFAWDLNPKWCNIVYLEDKELKTFKNICGDRDKGTWFLFEGLNLLLEKKGKLHVHEPKHMKIKKITSSKDLI